MKTPNFWFEPFPEMEFIVKIGGIFSDSPSPVSVLFASATFAAVSDFDSLFSTVDDFPGSLSPVS